MPEPVRVLAPIVITFALLLGLMWLGFGTLMEHRNNPNLNVVAGESGRVVLERNPAGRYVVPGTINDRDVTFLVDTGADHVAVPESVAESVGLQRGQRLAVGTAGGRSSAYRTRVDRIRVGGIELRGIDGVILPAMGGDAVLLGMSFLRHVDFSKQGNRLILEAGPS